MNIDRLIFDGFRDERVIKLLLDEIEKLNIDRVIRIMEVCGGHTHSIMKYGLHQLLKDRVEFIHGPGCPVCIMPKIRIDEAIALSQLKDIILVTLGDMIRVPGSSSTLQEQRAKGSDIRFVYSPMDIIKISNDNPTKKIIYYAIGFETTTPMTAALLDAKIPNILFHINHVIVPPAMNSIMEGDDNIDAFLGPSHVSVITGAKIYQPIVDRYKTPVVVTGFEPFDVLKGVKMILEQFRDGRCELEIEYSRSVSIDGNTKAQNLINKYMKLADGFVWRGIGNIPYSSMELREEYRYLDARYLFADILPTEQKKDNPACICGEILKGMKKPNECKIFGTICTPKNPIGSCMVSSEGACAAYYKYNRIL